MHDSMHAANIYCLMKMVCQERTLEFRRKKTSNDWSRTYLAMSGIRTYNLGVDMLVINANALVRPLSYRVPDIIEYSSVPQFPFVLLTSYLSKFNYN